MAGRLIADGNLNPTVKERSRLRGEYRLKRPDPVALWLYVMVGLVVAMVAVGGLTRLTHSGLSMVEWNLHHILPPLTEAQWQEAFGKYQLSPEYLLKNAGMDLGGFKGIFWLEYIHRLLGRFVGLAFILPFLYFLIRGQISGKLALRLCGLLALGAAQGVMGWLMVLSGLDIRPDVSHFRLAAHLLLALALFALLLWTALDRHSQIPSVKSADASKAKWALLGLIALVTLTVTWGAFVAGLGAGHVHQTFPLMDGGFFPKDGLFLDPPILNAVENPAAIQFVHRVLALTSAICLWTLWGWSKRADLAPLTRRALGLAAIWVLVQISLGLATLFSDVMVLWASIHQMGAVLLLGVMIWALHGVWRH